MAPIPPSPRKGPRQFYPALAKQYPIAKTRSLKKLHKIWTGEYPSLNCILRFLHDIQKIMKGNTLTVLWEKFHHGLWMGPRGLKNASKTRVLVTFSWRHHYPKFSWSITDITTGSHIAIKQFLAKISSRYGTNFGSKRNITSSYQTLELYKNNVSDMKNASYESEIWSNASQNRIITIIGLHSQILS